APQVVDKNSCHWLLPFIGNNVNFIFIDGDGVVTPTLVKTSDLGKHLMGQKKVYITFNGGYSPPADDTSQFLGQVWIRP
ncbi:hypothetical protein LINPERPRIM_LOCUS20380, partial [Linum perenne]